MIKCPIALKWSIPEEGLEELKNSNNGVFKSNIFKVLRVDLVKRFNYLDNPEVSEYGIRARVKFDF